MEACDYTPVSDNLIALRKLTPELKKAFRFMSVMDSHSTSWQEINTKGKGQAFIRGLLKVPEIAVADHRASAGTIFPCHQHPAHEIFIVYEGEFELTVDGKKVTITTGGKPYYFDGRFKHSAYFPVDTRWLAITIPADEDWPEGG